MSEVKVNKISPRTNCGTVQLGDSGDTITIPAGATITNNGTQTGFGRTGTVDWQTSIKTSATFSASNGEGYFVDTSSNAITANLPAGTAGAIVAFKDYAQTFDTNALTISANGSDKIEGQTFDLLLNTEGLAVTLVFGDSTKGWQAVNSNEITNAQKFVAATGGTITTVCTNFKVHTFTGPGTFEVTNAGNSSGSNTVDYLVVAGGGAGGRGASDSGNSAGGGGAGGFRESSGAASGCYTASPLGSGVSALPVSVQSYPIQVGGGGPAAPFPAPSSTTSPASGGNGSNSVFSTITSTGGGGGGNRTSPNPAQAGASGGSGGGGTAGQSGGTGNSPSVSPAQGKDGGTATGNSAGGGGGATVAGSPAPGPNSAGPGGAGATTNISASPVAYAGGGGSGGSSNGSGASGAPGGTGGGGKGSDEDGSPSGSVAGTTNRGGGGGGGGGSDPGTAGANGGSGIVIIRYKFQ